MSLADYNCNGCSIRDQCTVPEHSIKMIDEKTGDPIIAIAFLDKVYSNTDILMPIMLANPESFVRLRNYLFKYYRDKAITQHISMN